MNHYNIEISEIVIYKKYRLVNTISLQLNKAEISAVFKQHLLDLVQSAVDTETIGPKGLKMEKITSIGMMYIRVVSHMERLHY